MSVVVALTVGGCVPMHYAREPAHTEITSDHYGDPAPEPPLESIPPPPAPAPDSRG